MGENRSDILQGTLDLMVLQTLDAMGPLHGYGIARRIEQISEDVLQLNQGTIYASLLRLQQRRWISRELGHVGQQPQGQVLRDYPDRPKAAGHAGAELGTDFRRHGADAPAGTTLTAMPTWLAVLASRIHGLFTGRRQDAEFDLELASHLDLLTDEHIRRGLSAGDARREAILRFGGPVQIKEEQHERRSVPFVETTLQDLRYGVRALRKSPAYSLVAIATLAIGIGAGTAVFSVAGAVLLRPLPYKAPDELVRIFETNPLRRWTRNIAAPANYADWRARNKSFAGIGAYEQFTTNGSGAGDVFLTGFGEPQALKSLGVSGNLFDVLGAAPLLGRTFAEEEQWEGRSRVAVLSYGLWQSAFGGDPAIVGRTITLSGRAYDVVGVMPRTFFFPGRDVQLWIPFGYAPELLKTARRPHWLGVVARRRPGVSFEQARDDMTAIARDLEKQYPDTNTQMGVRLEPLHESYSSGPRAALLMLSGAVGLLFLIVCANIANLQLSRGVSRTRELAIRRALGAGRARILRQLFTESIVLSVVGGALGFGLAALARIALTRYAVFRDSAVRRGADRSRGAAVLARVVAGRADHLRHRAGAPHISQRAGDGSQRLRVARIRKAPRSPRGRGGRALDRARRGRGAAPSQPRPPAGCRSRFHEGACHQLHDDTAVRALRGQRGPVSSLRRNRAAPARAAAGAGGRRHQHAGIARLHLVGRHDDRRTRQHRLRARHAPHVDDAWLLRRDGHPPARRPAVR